MCPTLDWADASSWCATCKSSLPIGATRRAILPVLWRDPRADLARLTAILHLVTRMLGLGLVGCQITVVWCVSSDRPALILACAEDLPQLRSECGLILIAAQLPGGLDEPFTLRLRVGARAMSPSTLPRGLIARQISKWIDMPNDGRLSHSTATARGSFRRPGRRARADRATRLRPRPPRSPSTVAVDARHPACASRVAEEIDRPSRWHAEETGRRDPIWLGRPRRRLSAYQGEAGPADIRRWLSHGHRKDRVRPAQVHSIARPPEPHRRPTTDRRPIAAPASARSGR